MSTVSQLPASARRLSNPSGNGAYSTSEDIQNRTETYSYICDWNDWEAFRQVVVGLPQTFTLGGVSITRRVSLQSEITPALYAVSYDMKGQGKANTSADRPYNSAIFTITYAYPTLGNVSGQSPYYSISEQGSLRSVTVPNYKNSFPNGELLDSNFALTFPGVSIVLTLFQLNDVAAFHSAAQTMLGTPVNSSPITIGGLSVDSGKALFESYSTESTMDLFGVTQHSGQLNINVSSLKWNSFVRSDGVISELTTPPYQTGDLNTLIV